MCEYGSNYRIEGFYMLDKTLRFDFIKMHSKNCTPEQSLDNHLYYSLKYENGDFHEPVESFIDCQCYLLEFICSDKPYQVAKHLLKLINAPANYRANTILEDEFIYLMHLATKVFEFAHNYESAALMARKTVDMIEFFHPTNKAIDKEYFFEKNWYYRDCFEVYQKYKKYFNEEEYKKYIFPFEKDFYAPTAHANQNFKYRIHW